MAADTSEWRLSWTDREGDESMRHASEMITVTVYGGAHRDACDVLTKHDVPVIERLHARGLQYIGPVKMAIKHEVATPFWVTRISYSPPRIVRDMGITHHASAPNLRALLPSFIEEAGGTLTIDLPEPLITVSWD